MSTLFTSEIAPLRWFDLLADDADNDFFNVGLLETNTFVGQSSNVIEQRDLDGYTLDIGTDAQPNKNLTRMPAAALEEVASPVFLQTVPFVADLRHWQGVVSLQEHEIRIFRQFIDHVSQRLDLFDPLKHFSTLVPQMAMRNDGLMKSILALSARFMSIESIGEHTSPGTERTIAIRYYYETLQYLQGAMKYETYLRSPELIATAIIVSMYEMVDGSGSDWSRHLKGVFWIQRARETNGQSGGLEQAGWWNWLSMDIWAAFKERKGRCLSIYQPTCPYSMMNQYDVACRSIYLLSQAINYSCDAEVRHGEQNLALRIETGRNLMASLDEWVENVPIHFTPLPCEQNMANEASKPVWINPPALAAAMQMHSWAKILIAIHQPAIAGYRDLIVREKLLDQSIALICGIARTLKDDAATVISTQCLFGAGLYARDENARQHIAQLMEMHQHRTGWPTSSLAEELRKEWSRSSS